MGERGKTGCFCEEGDGFPGEDLGRLISVENEFGVGNGFFSGHVPGIEGVYDCDQNETDSDGHGVFSDIFDEEPEAGMA